VPERQHERVGIGADRLQVEALAGAVPAEADLLARRRGGERQVRDRGDGREREVEVAGERAGGDRQLERGALAGGFPTLVTRGAGCTVAASASGSSAPLIGSG
jgi:hypothetical protein